jgi:hypothetical protein
MSHQATRSILWSFVTLTFLGGSLALAQSPTPTSSTKPAFKPSPGPKAAPPSMPAPKSAAAAPTPRTSGDDQPSDSWVAPKTWSDPRVVDRLADDCRFDPDTLPNAEQEKWGVSGGDDPESPAMTCTTPLEQSCVDDPCYEGPQGAIACTQACTQDCRGCGKACALDCHTCKHTCKDRACRVACAQACAACHETCVRNRDRCSTGGCEPAYKGCWVAIAADWTKKGCAAVCKPFAACVDKCVKRAQQEPHCDDKCMPKDTRGCNLGYYCERSGADTLDPIVMARRPSR